MSGLRSAPVANGDPATAMLRATARYLHGKDFPALSQPRVLEHLARAIDLLGDRPREWLYTWSGWLEAPDTFLRLAVLLWPRLLLALGYTGGARWVAFDVSANTVRYHDGASRGTGDTSLFLAYKRHPLIEPSLWGAHLGSAEEEARHWLVVDRKPQVWYLAASEEARRFLATQWPRYSAPLEYTPEELTRWFSVLEEAASSPDWAERLEEALRESRANYRLMQQWLDAMNEAHEHNDSMGPSVI